MKIFEADFNDMAFGGTCVRTFKRYGSEDVAVGDRVMVSDRFEVDLQNLSGTVVYINGNVVFIAIDGWEPTP
jgi:hypothetical protein